MASLSHRQVLLFLECYLTNTVLCRRTQRYSIGMELGNLVVDVEGFVQKTVLVVVFVIVAIVSYVETVGFIFHKLFRGFS